jgi:hypothetical protein
MRIQMVAMGVFGVLFCSACGSANVQESGEACVGVEQAGAGEVVVDNAEDECGLEQVCLSLGSGVENAPPTAGQCSCRCDGPQEDASFCECLDGFVCKSLIEDAGNDHDFSGSYCVRDTRDTE